MRPAWQPPEARNEARTQVPAPTLVGEAPTGDTCPPPPTLKATLVEALPSKSNRVETRVPLPAPELLETRRPARLADVTHAWYVERWSTALVRSSEETMRLVPGAVPVRP